MNMTDADAAQLNEIRVEKLIDTEETMRTNDDLDVVSPKDIGLANKLKHNNLHGSILVRYDDHP